MFNRFVYIKLKTEWATTEGCASVIAESKRVLPTIPGVRTCRAGVPVDASSAKGWDLCLVLEFASAEDIEEYREHSDHQKFLEEFLNPKVEAKRAWDFSMQKLS